MEQVKTALDAPEEVVSEEVANSLAQQESPVNSIPAIGVRLNFANGATMKFEFAEDAEPKQLAWEINNFMQEAVGLINNTKAVAKENGLPVPFKVSNVLPNRKCTIDIVRNGHLMRGSLNKVPCSPLAFFKKEGVLFKSVITDLLTNAAKRKNTNLIAE